MDWGRRGKGKIRRRVRRTRRNSMRRKTKSSRRSSKGETKKILVSTSYVRRGRSGVWSLVRARFPVPEHTSFAQIFRMCKWSVRILWTALLSKPVSSAIILTLNRRSFAITARTTSTFWSFVDEIGLPERGSSSTFSRPSLRALCDSKNHSSR